MKFYRVKYMAVDEDKIFHNNTVYLFSPLKTEKDISRFVFNFWGKHYPNGFIVKDIEEISLEQFTKENEENLHTMILSIFKEG